MRIHYLRKIAWSQWKQLSKRDGVPLNISSIFRNLMFVQALQVKQVRRYAHRKLSNLSIKCTHSHLTNRRSRSCLAKTQSREKPPRDWTWAPWMPLEFDELVEVGKKRTNVGLRRPRIRIGRTTCYFILEWSPPSEVVRHHSGVRLEHVFRETDEGEHNYSMFAQNGRRRRRLGWQLSR